MSVKPDNNSTESKLTPHLDLDQVVVRDMISTDLTEVQRIEQTAQASPWARLSFEESLTRQDICRVATVDEKLIAYHVCSSVLDELHVLNIVCALPFQGMGVGHILMDDILTTATSKSIENLFLEVRESNHAAQSLYAKWGFTQIAIRENYYRPSTPDGPRENALVYMRAMY
ncbi:MAG: ribosomal protein S18-alanine N-acetyltransferase [Gammaproteobacteria bacterium]|nr:ribosomal protein S18-alanine N-acetyltransferase [Gammaproteobacteria bacterium]